MTANEKESDRKWHRSFNNNNKNTKNKRLLNGHYKNAKKVKKRQSISNSSTYSLDSNQMANIYSKSFEIEQFQKITTKKSVHSLKTISPSLASTPRSKFKTKKIIPNYTSIKMTITTSATTASSFIFPQAKIIDFNVKLKAIMKEKDSNFNDFGKTSQVIPIYANDMTYKPEVGLKIALVLGSMVLMIIFYLLWRNRCYCLLRHCGLSCGKPKTDDYDMEYWLSQIDNRKKVNNNEVCNAKLPKKLTDPRQQTAAWIVEHKKIWSNMHRPIVNDSKITKRKNSIASKNSNAQFNRKKERKPLKLDSESAKHRKTDALFLKQTTRRRTQCFEELDTHTQLLINYARIDAISNSKLDKLLESKIFKKSYFPFFNKKKKEVFTPKNSTRTRHEMVASQNLYNSKNAISELYSKSCQIIPSYARKRRHSWPRCKSDNLLLTYYNRELRVFFRKQDKKLKEMNKKKLKIIPDYELYYEHREEFDNLV